LPDSIGYKSLIPLLSILIISMDSCILTKYYGKGVAIMLTIDKIKQEVEALADKYNISKVDLFGSYATGNATEESDADFLVEFSVPIPSIFAVMGFKEELAYLLSSPVDVITLPITRPEVLNIEKVINIYERAG